MIFNSLTFLIFLVIVFSLYWLLDRKKQNILLVLASYVFYGWWDWHFLWLVIFSSLVDYTVARLIGGTEHQPRRRFYLTLSIVTQLSLLATFKYFNFFADSFVHVLNVLGMRGTWTTLNIVLPVGISFYTFQTMSYTIDVYRRRCPPHRNLIEFLAFVSFFPQLVAGPIERATNMLKQFQQPRRFDNDKMRDGFRQMLWGFFQKIVIADGLAENVNAVFGPAGPANGGAQLLACYFFAFQIYCDFAGYSNIAVGCARLFGFNLMRNFAYPYFARSIAEFWQRWHISLSTWFRDYLYIPLGGNRVPFGRVVLNILITFTVSGLWHGANWTFILWGLLNGLYFLPSLISRHVRGETSKNFNRPENWSDLGSILITFHLAVFAWVLFRSTSLAQVGDVLYSIVSDFNLHYFIYEGKKLKLLILLLLVVEWLQRNKAHALEISHFPAVGRWAVYNTVAFVILMQGTFHYTPFIYFQF
jgi:D-alanyl-lipoteichoic acid acyltransferase DltB (MBOAT superfamily)